jgi:hypothetical protein
MSPQQTPLFFDTNTTPNFLPSAPFPKPPPREPPLVEEPTDNIGLAISSLILVDAPDPLPGYPGMDICTKSSETDPKVGDPRTSDRSSKLARKAVNLSSASEGIFGSRFSLISASSLALSSAEDDMFRSTTPG